MLRLDGYAVDIDRASFGHEVVEIEKMSGPEPWQIASASEGVATLARSLGVTREGKSGRPVKASVHVETLACVRFPPTRVLPFIR